MSKGCNCANTGILSASLVREEEGRRIDVVVCGAHYNNEVAEKNIVSMHDVSGLKVNVLRVEKPAERQDKR